ncbi:hypothetical protein B0A48_04163 [Cryoendolithus antarcticus]|uniref:Uncharacterized protein n=1 Tax=Cryoendolithus antarcticus TaxID=1507870 RepID=A0A1V8TI04_9PEZI|nr:hypothetical protein B0A48_04163 [Cryoendolithus antarcticus]
MADTAANIITYVGVPLAVAGVLPILYNTIATLVLLRKVKKTLVESKAETLAMRSDVVNRIVEVELPRHRITPLDRDNHKYWEPQSTTKPLAGGTWALLEWKRNRMGSKVQRFQYIDELRILQAEISLGELVAYLLDLGAKPHPLGWNALRSNGLWTPEDQCLMSSPDGLASVLAVASSDDSDGHLSLKLAWPVGHFDPVRQRSSRGSGWVRLQFVAFVDHTDAVAESAVVDVESEHALVHDGTSPIEEKREGNAGDFHDCELAASGLGCVLDKGIEKIDISHLKHSDSAVEGLWFATILSAYATKTGMLPRYAITDASLLLVSKAVVPCGVLVILGMIPDSEAPEWSRKHQSSTQIGAQNVDSIANDRGGDRMQQARQQWMKFEHDRQVNIQSALDSNRWESSKVAQHSFTWLQSRSPEANRIAPRMELVVASILHQMIHDVAFARKLSTMLESWRAWSYSGGMQQRDLETLQSDLPLFTKAALLIGFIKSCSDSDNGKVTRDIHKCLEAHQVVRLG